MKWVENGYSEHLTIEQVIVKGNFHISSTSWSEWYKLGLQLVKHNIYGERVLSISSLGGRDLRLLDPIKLSFLKETLRKYAPTRQLEGVEFERHWSEMRNKVSQMCKRLRHLVDRYSLKNRAEQLVDAITATNDN